MFKFQPILYSPDEDGLSGGGGDSIPDNESASGTSQETPDSPNGQPDNSGSSQGASISDKELADLRRQAGRASALQSVSDKLKNAGVTDENLDDFVPILNRLREEPDLMEILGRTKNDSASQQIEKEASQGTLTEDRVREILAEHEKNTLTKSVTQEYNRGVQEERELVDSFLKSDAMLGIFNGVEPDKDEGILGKAFESENPSQRAMAYLLDTAFYEQAEKYPQDHPLAGRPKPMTQSQVQEAADAVFKMVQDLSRNVILQSSKGLNSYRSSPAKPGEQVKGEESQRDPRSVFPNSEDVANFASKSYKQRLAANKGKPTSQGI